MEEEEAIPTPVQETTLTTCYLLLLLITASIANPDCLEEPLPIATSVASEKSSEPPLMALTEYPDVAKVDVSNIPPEPDSLVCWMGLYMYICTYHMHPLY